MKRRYLLVLLPGLLLAGCLDPNLTAPAPTAVRKRLTETELQKVEFITDDGRQIRCPICREVADLQSMRYGHTVEYHCPFHTIIVDGKSESIWSCHPRD